MAHKSCENCGSSDAVYPYENGDYCFSCGHKTFDNHQKSMMVKKEYTTKLSSTLELPEDAQNNKLPDHAKLWLFKYHLTMDEIVKYDICYSEKYDRLFFPIYDDHMNLIYYQARALHPSKQKYINPSVLKQEFYSDRIHSGLTWVLVEDIVSAIRVGEHCQAIALLGKTASLKVKTMLAGRVVAVWLDDDAWDSALSLAQELRAIGCNTKMIRTKLDPKCYSSSELKHFLIEGLNS